MNFTKMDNAAEFTAKAVDTATSRYLLISGNQLNPLEIKEVASAVTGNKFIFTPGDLGFLSILIKATRIVSPGKDELYPALQGMQNVRNMLARKVQIKDLDNERYRNI